MRQKRNFLKRSSELCHKNGALFILDEMITGFRWHLAGAQTFSTSSRTCPPSARAWRTDSPSPRLAAARSHGGRLGHRAGSGTQFLLSTTHGAEMPGLGAFIEAMRIYRDEDVVGHLWQYGRALRDGIRAIAARHGLSDYVRMDGPAISLNYLTFDRGKQASLPCRTLLSQELLKRGVLMPWIAISQSHGESELQQTLDAFDGALKVYAAALTDGVEKHLQGPAIRPVFRTHN